MGDARKERVCMVFKGPFPPNTDLLVCNPETNYHATQRRYFVMIGAGSAMGPFPKLLALGGNVVALDIPGKTLRPRPRLKD